MALSIVEMLLEEGHIDEDELVGKFAWRFVQEPWRGYGAGARQLLVLYARGNDWRDEVDRIFDGGSYGNGGAMRAAPIGAYFWGDPDRAAEEARRAAGVTHAHIEGQAGAMAVAAATAVLKTAPDLIGEGVLRATLPHVPESKTREGVSRALELGPVSAALAAGTLGTGQEIAAFDTVPYCLWVVAHYGDNYEEAIWATLEGLGDRDTTCAIVGGILGPHTVIPRSWWERREPLPEDFRWQPEWE
jgi:ADP-ribosylglycohydrolase